MLQPEALACTKLAAYVQPAGAAPYIRGLLRAGKQLPTHLRLWLNPQRNLPLLHRRQQPCVCSVHKAKV